MNLRKYLFVDAHAAEDIVSTRFLQSEDFEQGKLLAVVLQGHDVQNQISLHTHIIQSDGGIFFLSDKSDHHDFLVIDLESAPIFEECSPREALVRFQKLLRFARRRWTKISPAPNEKLISGSTKAIVFPYPITTQSSFRITVELAPDKNRRHKRSKGIELLAYKMGTNEGEGPAEIAPVTNFRKGIDALADAHQSLVESQRSSQLKQQAKIDSLSVTRLQEGALRGAIAGCDYDQWYYYLTKAQKDFVEGPLTSPHRIEGPAGTGKTLSLVLKCIAQVRRAREQSQEHRALFVAHSAATRKAIEQMFEPEASIERSGDNALFALQSLKVTTLHELCGELLRYDLSDADLLDRDAFESKQSQFLYLLEALQEVIQADLPSHRPHMSAQFIDFIERTDEWLVADVLQHEIGVMIKGRADEDLEKYRRLPKLSYGLPVESAGDKSFAFLIFKAYQRRLQASGQFDTDDVVLSALQQLDTPIWRRRRAKEGYDAIYVDETHLFNINELSIFHRLTRTQESFPIAYSADVAQSLGDRGWAEVGFSEALRVGVETVGDKSNQTVFSSIFRCSPDIVNLAFSVTSSGATLFTNFHDPLLAAASAFTEVEERKSLFPAYVFFPSDEAMLRECFTVAETYATEMRSSRGDVAIVVFGSELFSSVEREAKEANKPVEVLKHRGDMEVVRKARASGRFVLSTPDYVGGLEFDAVVLVGVDKGRVPPKLSHSSFDSDNFVSYATHQRLYVAITRARFRVAILGVKARGVSDVLISAVSHGLLSLSD